MPVIPEKLLDMNDTPYLGTFHQLLYVNLGKTVTLEFTQGLNESRCLTGTLESVNSRYVMLKSLCSNTRYVGDMFALKYITFPCD